jgi:deoxycytidylate deaminase
MIINAGITEVLYGEGYNDPLADEMLEEARIPIKRYAS